ncbi:hypothetical protein E2C01_015644 [Portunus trituberculatus]|uniref:Uncharacterized protein n=1 Tax=Portunus trituberculatus TaxID=210409 RepID=A0A5B7DNY2_PORTR|nr:hypothetical protein [Portunus trituberculatus]
MDGISEVAAWVVYLNRPQLLLKFAYSRGLKPSRPRLRCPAPININYGGAERVLSPSHTHGGGKTLGKANKNKSVNLTRDQDGQDSAPLTRRSALRLTSLRAWVLHSLYLKLTSSLAHPLLVRN